MKQKIDQTFHDFVTDTTYHKDSISDSFDRRIRINNLHNYKSQHPNTTSSSSEYLVRSNVPGRPDLTDFSISNLCLPEYKVI